MSNNNISKRKNNSRINNNHSNISNDSVSSNEKSVQNCKTMLIISSDENPSTNTVFVEILVYFV